MSAHEPEPAWVQYALWWQVFPLGFLGGPPDALPDGAEPTHRLPALLPWLDYLIELGANGLLLGPLFASQTHGYDTVDHFRVDPRLGDEADVVELLTQAHARGVRVLFDGVFNHVGDRHPLFVQAVEDGRGAPSGRWFHLYWPDDATAPPEYEHFEGHRSLVTLNHAADEVVDLVAEVMTYWLDRGVDGWRLDAAYAVPPEFWARVVPRVRERHPEAYLVGEMIHGDYAGYVRTSGLDAVTQYELWWAIWHSLNDRNFFELVHALTRHQGFVEQFVPLTFVGNHDVTRIASRLEDPRLLDHALVVLLTVAGTPCLYAGDERAFRGVKEDRAGGDDAVRPAFPADPAQLAFGAAVLDRHRELIALRRRHPWLHRAVTTVTSVTNEQLVYTSAAGEHRLVVALNIADDAAHLDLPASGSTEQTGLTVLAGDGEPDGDTGLRVPGTGWVVLGEA